MRVLRTTLLAVCAALFQTQAELPLARLQSVFPMGGQSGASVEVTVEGKDLDDASQLHFSISGISSELKSTNSPGVFTVTIGSNVPPALYEVRMVGRFGISNPRFFTVGDRKETTQTSENRNADQAMEIGMESTVNALASPATAHFYRFPAEANQPVSIVCQAEPFDSRMSPALILYDAAGRELKRERQDGKLCFTPEATGLYCVKVHDLQYRGGKEFPYRLTVTRSEANFPPVLARLPTRSCAETIEHELSDRSTQPQIVSVPCEIRGQFSPQNEVDRFEFEAGKGEVFWIEVMSDRLGLPTDSSFVVQKVVRNDKGEESVSDLQEVDDSDPNLGGALFNTSTRDPRWRFEVKEEGRYRVQVRDQFKRRSQDPRAYRLSIRRESPDFDLIVLAMPPPPFDKEKREAQAWSPLLRRKETLLMKVLALRRDNFSGEISLEGAGLPAGAQVNQSAILENQNSAWLSLSADENVNAWAGPIRVIGKAKIGTNEVERVAVAASVIWDVADYNIDPVRSRLTQELVLGIAVEMSPCVLEPKQAAWESIQDTTVSIPLKISRSTDFKSPVKLRAYLDAQNDPIKEWEVDGQAAEANFDLDLKAAKLTVGTHQLAFFAQTSGKMRRVRPEEVSALESVAKADEAQRKTVEERVQLRDVTGIFGAPVVKLVINAAPAAPAK